MSRAYAEDPQGWLVLNGPVPALVWPIDLALSIACLKASGVLMSGFAAPALAATPLPTSAFVLETWILTSSMAEGGS